MGNKRKRKIWIFLACLTPLTLGALFLLGDSQQWPDHSFEVLIGKAPVSDEINEMGWGMDGPVFSSRGASSDDGAPLKRRQIDYVFKGDFEKIKLELEREVLSRGGEPSKSDISPFWDTIDGVRLFVSKEIIDPVTGNIYEEPGWVRVTVLMSKSEGRQGYAYRWIRNRLSK